MRKCVFASLVLVMVLAIMPVNAEVYYTELRVCKNDSIKVLSEPELIEGKYSRSYLNESDYSVGIISREGRKIFNMYISPFRYADGSPVSKDCVNLFLRLPYMSDAGGIRLYHNSDVIFSYEIAKYCGNKVCDSNENYKNCPQDCSKPSVTLPVTTTLPEKPKGFEDYLPYLVALFIIILITFLIHKRIKTAREIEKERKESELMEFVKEKLKEGEDPKTLKKGLKEEGYDPELVDKVERRLWD